MFLILTADVSQNISATLCKHLDLRYLAYNLGLCYLDIPLLNSLLVAPSKFDELIFHHFVFQLLVFHQLSSH